MNAGLDKLAAEVGVSDTGNGRLKLQFALACESRVRRLLEEPYAVACLDALDYFVHGRLDASGFDSFVAKAAITAGHHRGSRSPDGSAHAAVSATCSAANALAGKALEAASYAAYASVYAYGGYAVSDQEAFESAWQVEKLRELALGTSSGV